MKNLFICKDGKEFEVPAMKLQDDVLGAMCKRYDTCYEAKDIEGNTFKVYEHKGYSNSV